VVDVSDVTARLDDVERRLATVVRAVNDLAAIADDVTALSRRLAAPAGPATRAGQTPPAGGAGSGPAGNPSWFEVDADRAVAMLQDLTGWVAGILVRHHAAREALPECWMLHGEVVELLLGLKASWVAAYRDPHAGPALAADWHDRRLPGVADRIRRYPGRDCSLQDHTATAAGYRLREEHHPDGRVAVDGSLVAAYARWWAATRGLGEQWRPGADGSGQHPGP
jgi:hypothetical protein